MTSAQSALNIRIFKTNEGGIKFKIFLFNLVHKMYPDKGKSWQKENTNRASS